MVDTDWKFAAKLERQSWIHFSIGITFVVLRLYSRARRLGGVRNYETDDHLQIVAGCLYTVLIALLNTITDQGGSNLYRPESEQHFSPEDISARIQGSKLVLVSEQAMLNLIYILKASVLILYSRLTLNLTAQRFVRWLIIYVVFGWMASQITIFTACRPFSGYWAVPPPDPQCATYEHYAIVQGFFNISSDIFMLMIPLPLVIRMSVAWRQKLVLVFIFSLGICVIVAAILNKAYNLSDPYSPKYMLWYVREASVAIYVSNIPLVWPLVREWIPFLRGLKTAGVLPTPHAGGRTARTGEKHTTASSILDGMQEAPRPGLALLRMETFAEFGKWLRAEDLELQTPPRAFLQSPSRVPILETPEEDSGGSGDREQERRRWRLTFAGTVFEEAHAQDLGPGWRTIDADLERGDFVWDSPAGKEKERAIGFNLSP